ncbi:MAG: hypothetical protein H6657_11650 [Ardenticatenaceae bacterium]|nr:hypothetical protein [Ardenticatenaceae bacterium]
MNQAVPQTHKKQPQRWPLAGLLLLFLLLTACIGGGDAAEEAAPEAAVQTTATLRCSESCQAYGQCGLTTDGRTVILARSFSAGLRDHDVLMASDSGVTILTQEAHIIQEVTGVQSNLTFYYVQPAEGGFSNWVAGSCVELSAP